MIDTPVYSTMVNPWQIKLRKYLGVANMELWLETKFRE